MDIEIKAWLYDILNAINEIDSFFTDTPKEFTAYQNDVKTRREMENAQLNGKKNHMASFRTKTINKSMTMHSHL